MGKFKRDILFNILFFLYIVLIQPHFLKALHVSEFSKKADIFWVVVIFGIQILELFGIYFRLPLMATSFLNAGKKFKVRVKSFYIFVCHMLINVMLTMFAFQLLGFKISPEGGDLSGSEVVEMIVLCLIVIKELAILFGMINIELNIEEGKAPIYSAKKELLGDVILLIFSMFAISGTWVYLSSQDFINPSFGDYIGSALFFVLFYSGARFIYVIEWTETSQKKDYILIAATVIASMLAATFTL